MRITSRELHRDLSKSVTISSLEWRAQQELNLPWAAAARKAAGKKLGRGRWTACLKDGTLLILKP
jgi:hypothetical protein